MIVESLGSWAWAWDPRLGFRIFGFQAFGLQARARAETYKRVAKPCSLWEHPRSCTMRGCSRQTGLPRGFGLRWRSRALRGFRVAGFVELLFPPPVGGKCWDGSKEAKQRNASTGYQQVHKTTSARDISCFLSNTSWLTSCLRQTCLK